MKRAFSGAASAIDHAPGAVLAGCTIIRQAAKATRETRFLVLASCGHEHIFFGHVLRKKDSIGELGKCPPCSMATRKPRTKRSL